MKTIKELISFKDITDRSQYITVTCSCWEEMKMYGFKDWVVEECQHRDSRVYGVCQSCWVDMMWRIDEGLMSIYT